MEVIAAIACASNAAKGLEKSSYPCIMGLDIHLEFSGKGCK